MNKIAVFQKSPVDPVSIVRPVPWARLVSAIEIGLERVVYVPPQRLENVSKVRNIEAYATLLDEIASGAVKVEWAETEDQFCVRLCEEQTDEIETDAQMTARLASATTFRDRIPFKRATGRRIRKVVPDGVAYFVVDASEIPTDRKQRMALILTAGRPVVDPAKMPA